MARVFLLLSTPPLFWQEATEGTDLRSVKMPRAEKGGYWGMGGGPQIRTLLIHLYPSSINLGCFS